MLARPMSTIAARPKADTTLGVAGMLQTNDRKIFTRTMAQSTSGIMISQFSRRLRK